METQTRVARIDGMDLETGAFSMTLATEGEASDGHILSIKGGQIPERMPMLLSHWNDPTAAVGSVVDPKKHTKDSPPRLTATGQIEMGGEGMPAEVRRDVALMIDKGHINAVSIRWDEIPGKSIRRINLPSNHKYFVDAAEEKGPARWGMFFEEWRAMEGSIVALGADPGALIGRAKETTGEVAAFWRAMAGEAEADGGSKELADDGRIAATLSALRTNILDALHFGASLADITNAVVAQVDGTISGGDVTPCRVGDHKFYLPASVAEQLNDDREELELARTSAALEPDPEPVADLQPATRVPDPEPAPEAVADQRSPLELQISEIKDFDDLSGLLEFIGNELDAYDQRSKQQVRELLDHAAGKVS